MRELLCGHNRVSDLTYRSINVMYVNGLRVNLKELGKLLASRAHIET